MLRGGCDPLVTPRPLGPVRDLLADLRPLDGASPLSEVCEVTYAALRSEPTVVVVEDLHWVDAASAEVLRFLLRRLEAMPCAVVLTYRDDEIGEQHSVRPLLGDLAALGGVATLHLEPLSVEGVAALVEGTPLDPAAVHALTGGNPFFATEVAKDPDLPLPATVRDAVLARTAGIAAEDFEVLQLAASAPDRLDDRVLPSLGVDFPTLRRLHGTGLLLRQRGGLVFRHELARLAVESTIPAGGTARLHARLLRALETVQPQDPAVLTHHAVAAADAPRAARYAQAAAEEAARSGAHTEAVAFLETALAHLPGADPRDRAMLLTRLGVRAVHDEPAGPGDRHRERDLPAVAGRRRRHRPVDGARLVRGDGVLQRPPRVGADPRRAGGRARRAHAARVRPGPGDAGVPRLHAR